MPYSMKVIKRDGKKEDVSFDKVLQRIRKAAKGLKVNPDAPGALKPASKNNALSPLLNLLLIKLICWNALPDSE